MLTDPMNKDAGTTVLAACGDNLGCLYLHLLENASLCTAVETAPLISLQEAEK